MGVRVSGERLDGDHASTAGCSASRPRSSWSSRLKRRSSASASPKSTVDTLTPQAPKTRVSESIRAAVGVVTHDDVVTRGERAQQRVFPGESRREGDAVAGSSRSARQVFERGARRVVAARVVRESNDARRRLGRRSTSDRPAGLTAPVTASGSEPTCIGPRVETIHAITPSLEEAEQVTAREHAHRVTTVEDQHARP